MDDLGSGMPNAMTTSKDVNTPVKVVNPSSDKLLSPQAALSQVLRQDVTPHNHCHLLDLPAELRTYIYELAFSNSEGHLDKWAPLLKANKQIYNEAISIHYAYTPFHFSMGTLDRSFQIYSRLPRHYRHTIKHLNCDEPCWRFNAKGAARTLHCIQVRAEKEFGVPADFVQVVMRVPREIAGADAVIYTHDPEALAKSKGWMQVDWDSELRNLGPLRKLSPWMGKWK